MKFVFLLTVTAALAATAPGYRALARKITYKTEQSAPNGARYTESYESAFKFRGGGAFAIQNGLAKPVKIVAADFNGDGIKDVVVLYSYNGQSLVARYLGQNGEAGSAAGIVAPFARDALVTALPGQAAFLIAGDFNGDGLADAIVATQGSNMVHYLENKGAGEFAEPRRVEMEGEVTALAAHDIGRPDGLLDVLVAVKTGSGASLATFTHPSGAMRAAAPEMTVIPLEQVDSISISAADEEGFVHAVAGNKRARAAVYTAGRRKGQSAKLSEPAPESPYGDSLQVFLQLPQIPGYTYASVSAASPEPVLIRAAFARTYTIDDPRDFADPNAGTANDDGICNSYPANNQGVPIGGCTFRSAIQNANLTNLDGHGSGANFNFAINSLNLTSGNSQIIIPAIIDGTTAPGGFVQINCVPNSGGSTIFDPVGIHLSGGNPIGSIPGTPAVARLIKGFHIVDCGTGIRVANGAVYTNSPPRADGAVVVGNLITGPLNAPQGVQGYGILSAADSNVIGDSNPALGNSINSVAIGIGLGSGLIAQGLTAPYQSVFGNSILRVKAGVIVNDGAISAKVGGSNPGEGNTIGTSVGDAFTAYGIGAYVNISAGFSPEGLLIQGNRIGTDGTNSLNAKGAGIFNSSVKFVTIGGTTVGARNYVSSLTPVGGSAFGIYFLGNNGLIGGNFLGYNLTGLVGSNGTGIYVAGGNNVQIGGSLPGAANFIGGWTGQGIEGVSTTALSIQGNYIGINSAGGAAPNGGDGIRIASLGPGSKIGGENPGEGNVLSGNTGAGLSGGFDNTEIKGNKIGVDANSLVKVPNGTGVNGSGEAGPVFGGTTAAAANIIAGNTGDGVILDSRSGGLAFTGNYVGTTPAGATNLGNGGNGLVLKCCYLGVNSNVIQYNTGAGIRSDGHQSIRSNSIFANGGLGIDLITSNYNPPTLAAASSFAGTTLISGTVAAIFPFNEIEFFASPSCDASGSGEGKTYLGKLTGPANNFTFNAAVSVPAGSVATATYVFGNLTPLVTSKFSNCVPIATCAANVTGQVAITRGGLRLNRATGRYAQIVRVTNNGEALTSPLSLTFDSLAAGVTLYQPGGTTSCSAPFSPYLSLPAGLAQGAFVDLTVEFTNPSNGGIQYGNRLLSGTNR